MLSSIATLIASMVSLFALLEFRNGSARRLRVLGVPKNHHPKARTIGWLGILIPPLILLYFSLYSSFFMWFFLVTLIGWGLSLSEAKPND